MQAVIFDKTNKTLSTYDPLVITDGTTPAAAPVAFTPPANSDVAIFGGGNDDTTTLVGPGAAFCVNGAAGAVFGQVFFCNAAQLFADINAAGLTIPPLGTDSLGQPCPTVRSFKIVDQDQSDNVQTTYLVTPTGQTAQNNAANVAALTGSFVQKNPSDNRLLSNFVDPAINCTAWKLPDISSDNALTSTQATDELQAAAYQGDPMALIPLGDPMVGPGSLAMVNAYRVNVDQPLVKGKGEANTTPYCKHLQNTAPGFIAAHKAEFLASPSPAAGVNLYDFLQGRFTASLQLLNCKMKGHN